MGKGGSCEQNLKKGGGGGVGNIGGLYKIGRV